MRTLILLLFILLVKNSLAADVTAIRNGKWSEKTTWNCQCLPGNGDHITIPATMSVQSDQQILLNLGPQIEININGALELDQNNFYIDPDDVVILGKGGKIIAGVSGAVIYSGVLPIFISINHPINGPATIFAGALPSSLLFFKAEPRIPEVLLTWASSIGHEGDVVTIKRSRDGIFFDTLTQINGGSVSGQRVDGSYYDKHSPGEIVYYRLCLATGEGILLETTIIYINERPRKKTY